jgi:hypothetical protein
MPARSASTDALFRLRGAVRKNQSIDAFLAEQAPELGALAARWFACLRRCGPDVRDVMHDGSPTACVQDAAFAYVGVFTAHVNVGFFHGADLPDPGRLLLGSGKRMRHVQIRPSVDLDEAALDTLVRDAYADIKRRLASERNSKPEQMPRQRDRRAHRPGRT